MQGQRSSITTLPVNLNESTSLESDVDLQMSWNDMQSSAQNLLLGYTIPSSGADISYQHHATHEGNNAQRSIRQTNSNFIQIQVDQNEGIMGHTCSIHSQPAITLQGHQHGMYNFFPSDNADVNSNGNHTTNGSSVVHDSSSGGVLPQNRNIISGYRNHEDDGSQVFDRYGMRVGENRTESLDSQRESCKRKASDGVGESSGAGSSNCYQSDVRIQWNDMPAAAQVAVSNNRIPVQISNNNRLELSNSRRRIDIGGTVSAPPFYLNAVETGESSRRNFFAPISGPQQQVRTPVNPMPTESNSRTVDASSSWNSSRLIHLNRPLNLNPAPAAEDGRIHGQTAFLQVPFVRRNLQSMWNGSSSPRTISSSPSTLSLERDASLYQEAPQRNIPRNIQELPLFVPASGRSSSQHSTHWNFASGNNSMAGNVASTYDGGSSFGVNSLAPSWSNDSNRTCPQYPGRWSEFVRGSPLSLAGNDSGVQSSNPPARPNSSAASREVLFTPGSGTQGSRLTNLRPALLGRNADGDSGIPYPLRYFAYSGEVMNTVMSEIRRMLDLLRRGDGLRLEELANLDSSIIFGMADFLDQHREMRVDVDNMSYEELLALEDRIGNVNTGLSGEIITNLLRKKKYFFNIAENSGESADPCCICQEEYAAGDDLGALDCGHDFHKDCIKQWLLRKNVCPICKSTGLTT